jgi:hypothetical protein
MVPNHVLKQDGSLYNIFTIRGDICPYIFTYFLDPGSPNVFLTWSQIQFTKDTHART